MWYLINSWKLLWENPQATLKKYTPPFYSLLLENSEIAITLPTASPGQTMLGNQENSIFTAQNAIDRLIYSGFFVKFSAVWGIFV